MLAGEHPEKPAIIFIHLQGPQRTLRWQALDRGSNQLARLLREQGVDDQSLVVVGLPNYPEHFICNYAAWKLGTLVPPVR